MASRRYFIRSAALGTLFGAVADRLVRHGDSPTKPSTTERSASATELDAYRAQMKRYITAASLAQAPRLDG